MRFARDTHDKEGRLKVALPSLVDVGDFWPTCDIHMISGEMTIAEIHAAHLQYDEEWYPEIYGFSIAQIMEGLAAHLRLGTVKIVEW